RLDKRARGGGRRRRRDGRARAVTLECLAFVEPDAASEAAHEAAHEHLGRQAIELAGLELLENVRLGLRHAAAIVESRRSLRPAGAERQCEARTRISNGAGASGAWFHQ